MTPRQSARPAPPVLARHVISFFPGSLSQRQLLSSMATGRAGLHSQTGTMREELSQGARNSAGNSRRSNPKTNTRHGVYRLVERCAARVPALGDRKISPHMVRHSCACHLLGSGVDINTILAWLGHVSLETTNIYAEIDLEMKARAMALTDTAEPGPNRPWKDEKGVMAFLAAL